MASIPAKDRHEASRKAAMGRPRAFKTEDDYQQKLTDYLIMCGNQEPKLIPNVMGFANYCDVARTAIYMCESYFPDTFQKMKDAFGNHALNCDPKRLPMGIFTLKNTEGWTDRVQTDTNVSMLVASVTDEELERRLAACGYVKQLPEK